MFDRVRRVIAVLIAVGLAAGVYLAWPRDGDDSDDGVTLSSTTTTAVTVSTTTTTLAGTTTTTGAASHVVTTVEEAEEILREHYTLWFTGIYEEDEALIRSTVILDELVDAARSQFGVMEFSEPPSAEGLTLVDVEILRSDEGCIAVWSRISATFRPGSSEGVAIFRWIEASWKVLSTWTSRGDLWEADCESVL